MVFAVDEQLRKFDPAKILLAISRVTIWQRFAKIKPANFFCNTRKAASAKFVHYSVHGKF